MRLLWWWRDDLRRKGIVHLYGTSFFGKSATLGAPGDGQDIYVWDATGEAHIYDNCPGGSGKLMSLEMALTLDPNHSLLF